MKISQRMFLILFSLCAAPAGPAEAPVIQLHPTGERFPVAWNIDTGGAASLLLQNSTDLLDWQPLINIFTKARLFRFVDWSGPDQAAPRFYRAIAPGQSVDEMLGMWRALGLSKYQYKLRWSCFCRPLSGTVTVHDGKVVAVTDARDSNGSPIPNPDLSEFKSIEDLFEIVRRESAAADALTVVFDRIMNFPTRIEIDYISQAVDDEIAYEASDVRPIP